MSYEILMFTKFYNIINIFKNKNIITKLTS